jgi:hypothetical protein
MKFPPHPTIAALRTLLALASLSLAPCTVRSMSPDATPVSLPLYFETSTADSGFQFIARGQTRAVQIAPGRAMVSLVKSSGRLSRHEVAGQTVRGHSVSFDFQNTNPEARLTGLDELPGRINYLIGNDPAGWRRNLSTFQKIRTRDIYRGIDLIYYGNQDRLEYDFVVAPGADPGVIAFRVSGADRLRVDELGDLVMTLGGDTLRQLKPVAWQVIGGRQELVSAAFRLRGNEVTFDLGKYDRTRELVIDPILNYVRYFNGSASDTCWDIALTTNGSAGFLLVAGETLSANLPATPGAFTNQFAGGSAIGGDAFVAKVDLNRTTSNLVWLTYLGGITHDAAVSVATDAVGDAYITGYTGSTNFPVAGTLGTNLNGGLRTTPTVQNVDAFVAKLSASGSNLLYSMYLGGTGADQGFSIAVSPAGVAYVTGFTTSTNFPNTTAFYTNSFATFDAFVTAISSDGQSYQYSFPYGGTDTDQAEAIQLGDSGYAYVCGYSRSPNFPITTNIAWQPKLNQITNLSAVADAFLLKVSPTGTVTYSSFLGGNQDDIAYNLTLDDSEGVLICGRTGSTNFFITSTNLPRGVSSTNAAGDIFVTRFDASLTNVVFSTVFGGAGVDEAWDISLDSAGRIVLVGDTVSTNLPRTNFFNFLLGVNSGGSDSFVARLKPSGDSIDFLGYLGGSGNDLAYALQLDASDNIYFAGQNGSANFPGAPPLGGTADGFIMKILSETPRLAISQIGGNVELSWAAFNPEYQLQTALRLPPTNSWTTVTGQMILGNRHVIQLAPTNDAAFFRLRFQ